MSDSKVENEEVVSDDVKRFLEFKKIIKGYEEFLKNPGDATEEEIGDAEYLLRDFTKRVNEGCLGLPPEPRKRRASSSEA